MIFRIKVMSAGGRGVDSVTMKTSSNKREVRRWGRNARKHYPNNSVVVQYQDAGGSWRDYRLIEDF